MSRDVGSKSMFLAAKTPSALLKTVWENAGRSNPTTAHAYEWQRGSFGGLHRAGDIQGQRGVSDQRQQYGDQRCNGMCDLHYLLSSEAIGRYQIAFSSLQLRAG